LTKLQSLVTLLRIVFAVAGYYTTSMAQAPHVTGYEHEDAWDVDWLRVDDIHELHYQQFGKKDGKPGGCNISPSRVC
jgi:hypothetical protein